LIFTSFGTALAMTTTTHPTSTPVKRETPNIPQIKCAAYMALYMRTDAFPLAVDLPL